MGLGPVGPNVSSSWGLGFPFGWGSQSELVWMNWRVLSKQIWTGLSMVTWEPPWEQNNRRIRLKTLPSHSTHLASTLTSLHNELDWTTLNSLIQIKGDMKKDCWFVFLLKLLNNCQLPWRDQTVYRYARCSSFTYIADFHLYQQMLMWHMNFGRNYLGQFTLGSTCVLYYPKLI